MTDINFTKEMEYCYIANEKDLYDLIKRRAKRPMTDEDVRDILGEFVISMRDNKLKKLQLDIFYLYYFKHENLYSIAFKMNRRPIDILKSFKRLKTNLFRYVDRCA